MPTHRNQAFGRWATGAEADGAQREYDVVHAHDFTALEVGDRLARRAGVPLVYDSHELWSGRARQYRPTPLQDRRERREEAALGRAEAVSAGALEFGAVRGTLAGGFKVASVRWRDDRGAIALSDVALAWRPDGLLRGELHVTRLEIGIASNAALSAPRLKASRTSRMKVGAWRWASCW